MLVALPVPPTYFGALHADLKQVLESRSVRGVVLRSTGRAVGSLRDSMEQRSPPHRARGLGCVPTKTRWVLTAAFGGRVCELLIFIGPRAGKGSRYWWWDVRSVS